jgi:hypothetical protein
MARVYHLPSPFTSKSPPFLLLNHCYTHFLGSFLTQAKNTKVCNKNENASHELEREVKRKSKNCLNFKIGSLEDILALRVRTPKFIDTLFIFRRITSYKMSLSIDFQI